MNYKGVYIHIPFCKSICSYCDFCKFLYKKEWIIEYLNALEKEIQKYYENEEVNTIYIGGGTPSCLDVSELKILFEILKIFNINQLNEVTIELNINDINEELVCFLKTTNVNRLSIGVESFNELNLQFLNRKHDENEISDKIKLLRKYGYDNISVDLIYGLPIESLSEVKYDVKNILKLGVEHISTYSLIIEDHTFLKYKNVELINEEIDYKMYNYICKTLKSNKYEHYEVSNFSLPGYHSIHNMNYWNNLEYFGFGLGASGFINGIRYENTRDFTSYKNGNYRKEEVFVSKTEDMENEIMLGFRKIKGINLRDFYNKFKCNIQDVFEIKGLMKEGLLVLEGEYLKIPEDKIYIMNEILTRIELIE